MSRPEDVVHDAIMGMNTSEVLRAELFAALTALTDDLAMWRDCANRRLEASDALTDDLNRYRHVADHMVEKLAAKDRALVEAAEELSELNRSQPGLAQVHSALRTIETALCPSPPEQETP